MCFFTSCRHSDPSRGGGRGEVTGQSHDLVISNPFSLLLINNGNQNTGASKYVLNTDEEETRGCEDQLSWFTESLYWFTKSLYRFSLFQLKFSQQLLWLNAKWQRRYFIYIVFSIYLCCFLFSVAYSSEEELQQHKQQWTLEH